jgi:TonB family protein
MSPQPVVPDVYSVGEVARASGASPSDVRRLIQDGTVRSIDGTFLSTAEAVRTVRQLVGRSRPGDRALFSAAGGLARRPALPIALSSALHALIGVAVLLFTTMGLAGPAAVTTPVRNELRLVFLAQPGPGGGGGGGGRREPRPAPAAERKGVSTLRSPIPIRRPPPTVDPPPIVRVSEPPPVKTEALPPIIAPVVSVPADTRDRVGVPAQVPAQTESHGQGEGGGAGTGRGTGLGEGTGPGIGPGSGGGTGGGPYRPGSGIDPPSVIREVKPDYSDEARRRGLEGDVVLEIVVRRDGSVGDVRVLQGLGAGLDQRATDAVRQWRFSPAHRQGTPVDVIVEVAVEFKLR